MWQRFTMIFKSKANKALDRAEDPRNPRLLLREATRSSAEGPPGVADVATSRKRLELQIGQLDQQSAKLETQAKAALAGGREDLAREALTRRSGLTTQLNDLHAQLATLQDQEEKLTQASQRLQAKVDAFRTREGDDQATYPQLRHRRRSTRRSRASPRNSAMSAWPSSALRTRPSPCRPGPVPSTS